jgi:toxin ParE1/3/4
MATYSVIFAPEAEDDLIELYDYIAMQDGSNRAFDYTERIRLFCIGLASFPGRAARRDDLRPGLRTVGFERRVTIAFHVTPGLVVIDRISYGGRNVETLLDGA